MPLEHSQDQSWNFAEKEEQLDFVNIVYGLSYSVFIHISPCLISKIFHIISGGPLKRQIVQPQYIIRKQCFKMKWRTLSWESVKSGGKFHHRRKLCQVLTPPPTARKLNFPPWQFLSCSLPPPRAHICHEYHELYSWRKTVILSNFSFLFRI